ncbi:MAG: aldo/keto reductase [Calditrichaceae bacterium]|nr:aldo/keto reductase [Calditrichia bacterium]NUQ41956.1 aldo/keto reductase [Calditrichaceae bacterium]
MNTRQLGKDGPHLTEIGLGAWAIGGPWTWGWGEQDDVISIKTIQLSLALGINWIDTAAVYGLGHGEEVVAKAVNGRRKEVFIASKCGLVWDERRRVRNNNRPESIRKECENSLRRLRTDYLDLYQIHWPDKNVPVEESWGEMVRLKEAGKVRYIGVSNFGMDLLQRCQAVHPVASLQPPYNMVQREVEKEILPWCREHGVGVVAYSPLLNGLLTGKFSREFLATLADDDWRKARKQPFFTEPLFSRVLAFVEQIRLIADKYQKTPAQLAIAWVLMHPAVTSAIVGARSVSQAEQNIGGAGWQMLNEDMERIDELYRETLGE